MPRNARTETSGTETSGAEPDRTEESRTPKARRTPGALPLAATVLTGTVALYMALVALGNITDFDTNRQFVRHVLAMDTTFQDRQLMWRAITSHTLQDGAYLAIIGWETVTAAVLVLATALGVKGLRRGDFAGARRLATAGLLMVLVLFGAGFLAIGGEWFAMWQSKAWNGLEAATRNFLVAGLVLVIVHLPGTAAGQQEDGR